MNVPNQMPIQNQSPPVLMVQPPPPTNQRPMIPPPQAMQPIQSFQPIPEPPARRIEQAPPPLQMLRTPSNLLKAPIAKKEFATSGE
jgi:hypothetical protein